MHASDATMRQDKGPRVRLGATPIEVRPNGSRVYRGTAAFGDVVAAYPDLDPPRNEFRPADEVMSPAALASLVGLIFTGGPRTRDWDGSVSLPAEHADDLLTPDNALDAIEGMVIRGWREDPPGDVPHLQVEVIAHTAPMIHRIESGTVELSLGYMAREDKTPGVHNGVAYDRIQRGHIYNHLNLVERARSRTPDGRAARLDKSPDSPAYSHPENAPAMLKDSLDAAAAIMDAPELSAEDAALLKQMSPDAQAMFGAPAADAAAPPVAAAAELGEVAGVEMASAGESSGAMDLAPVLAAIADLQARIAVLEGGKADAPPPPGDAPSDAPAEDSKEKPAEKKDSINMSAAATLTNPAAVIAAAQAAAAKTATATFNASAAFVGIVRNDGHKANTTDEAAAVMLATVKAHLPILSAVAEDAVKTSRLDSLATLYQQAEAIRRDSLMAAQAEALGDVFRADSFSSDAGHQSDDGILRFPAA